MAASYSFQITFDSRHVYRSLDTNLPQIKSGPDAYTAGPRSDFTVLAQADLTNILSSGALVYVPSVLNQTACPNTTYQQYIPDSVIQKSDTISKLELKTPFYAFFPWLNDSACMAEFMHSSRVHGVRSILTYLVDNSTTVPPGPHDASWNINGSTSWQQNSPLSVLALNSSFGLATMAALTTQSMSGATQNDYGPTTDAWLIAAYTQPSSNSVFAVVPDLWTIVLAVLAAFVCVLAIISGVLHCMQGRRRRDLRRRIAAGEVDLNVLGIRKLTVPQAHLDKIPIKPYSEVSNATVPIAAQDASIESKVGDHPPILAEKSPTVNTAPAATADSGTASTSNSTQRASFFNQPTCAICIDDFEPDTSVRFLPCGHIFHPACVDPHFLENSSLCPMCKKSILPPGYCPTKVTNSMVRRERIAVMRDREGANQGAPQSRIARLGIPVRSRTVQAPSDGVESSTSPIQRVSRAFGRTSRQPEQTSLELRETNAAATPTTGAISPDQNCPSNANSEGRREWARRRALQLMGNGRAADPAAEEIAQADEEQQRRRPMWRKAVGVIFPSRNS